MSRSSDTTASRPRQILIGASVIVGFGAFLALLWLGRLLPGFTGEVFGLIVGIMSTPLLMEPTIFLLGFVVLITINLWRQKREGDEFVYLERVEGPGTEALPESARWVVYREPPLDGAAPDLTTRAEGALEIGDHEAALEAFSEMSAAERESPAALALRIRLARQTGKPDLAARLQARLEATTSATRA